MRDYYIFRSGRFKREANTLFFHYKEDGKNEKKVIPVEDVDSVFLFGEIDLNTRLINFLSQHNIILHFFNYYGYYTGTYYPKEFLSAGDIIVRQSWYYLNQEYRLTIAQQFIEGAVYGIIQNLKRYKETTSEYIEKIETLAGKIETTNTIEELMAIEGNVRGHYYRSFNTIIKQDINFEKRVKNPPDNMINAIISFMNSMVYTTVLKEIYKTQLNPTVSFLHEPSYRRFSLALDVAEIFKPLYADRIIFNLLNNNMITKDHFDKDLNYAYLSDSGRKIVVREFDEKMKTTVFHKQLKKKVSYAHIIRLELYKLIKHILEEKEYKSFRIWW